jgi:SAM-dependent methyltransferase
LRYFRRGTLLDYNPAVREIYDALQESIRQRLDLVIADFIALPLSSVEYDCVVACEVLEHVENDEGFIDKMCASLRPQGQLVISVPSRMKLWSRHDEIAGHLRRYEKDSILATLSRRKLVDVEVASYGFPFVNALRYLRIALAYLQYHKKMDLSKVERTRKSGLIKSAPLINLIGLICNRYTCYPFNLVASLFNHHDLSDGYLIIAEKR